jgi:hypothetical protein
MPRRTSIDISGTEQSFNPLAAIIDAAINDARLARTPRRNHFWLLRVVRCEPFKAANAGPLTRPRSYRAT